MVLNNIEQLLEKYENGETSLKEEQQLKDYFSQETVAPHLEMYKPIFCYFLVNQQEQFTKHVPLKTKRVINYKWLSVAAVTVLMAGFYFKDPSISKKDREDYEIAKAALASVSKHFNKGVNQVNYLGTLGQATKQVAYLDEMNNPMSRIFKNN